jgi:hypothetical protein
VDRQRRLFERLLGNEHRAPALLGGPGHLGEASRQGIT